MIEIKLRLIPAEKQALQNVIEAALDNFDFSGDPSDHLQEYVARRFLNILEASN